MDVGLSLALRLAIALIDVIWAKRVKWGKSTKTHQIRLHAKGVRVITHSFTKADSIRSCHIRVGGKIPIRLASFGKGIRKASRYRVIRRGSRYNGIALCNPRVASHNTIGDSYSGCVCQPRAERIKNIAILPANPHIRICTFAPVSVTRFALHLAGIIRTSQPRAEVIKNIAAHTANPQFRGCASARAAFITRCASHFA